MRALRPLHRTAAISFLLAALLIPAAGATVSYKPRPAVSGSCPPLDGPAADTPPRPRDTIGLDFTADMLAASDTATVSVCALVDSLGIVRQARVELGDTPYDSAAVDAVHWWQFAPARLKGRAVQARVSVAVLVRPPQDADPLVPDVQALAIAAESEGRTRDALDAWTGALARTGLHPALGNEWVIRERILRLAASMGTPPALSIDVRGRAIGAHNRMLRDMSRATNADLAKTLDGVLLEAPWYASAYRWRASARAASGQRAGAIRDVLCYQISAPDSAGRAVADRALVALATGDTLTALTLLKHE
jgi:hypothetical protein